MNLEIEVKPGACLCDECIKAILWKANLNAFDFVRAHLERLRAASARREEHKGAPVAPPVATPAKRPPRRNASAQAAAFPPPVASAPPVAAAPNDGEEPNARDEMPLFVIADLGDAADLKGAEILVRKGRGTFKGSAVGRTADGEVVIEFVTGPGAVRRVNKPLDYARANVVKPPAAV
jgi:hypothetical protein